MIVWSEEQKKVISTGNADILVSAAAGSGKTAVLVERILRLVTAEGVSLDELIVMTFTKAAASEMRERLEKGLRERLASDPGSAHIRLQLAILPRARIATIDSVCQGLIKQYYQLLDIDPGFRIADEGELKVMRADILKELMAGQFENAEPAFLRLVDSFGDRYIDKKITELVEKLYDFAQSETFPERFLRAQLEESGREMLGDYEDSVWFRLFMDEIRSALRDHRTLLELSLGICGEADGPAAYAEDIENCIRMADSLLSAGSYGELYREAARISFPKFPTIRKNTCDPQKRDFVRTARSDFKDHIQKTLLGRYLLLPPELFGRTAAGSAGINRTVVQLALEFLQMFGSRKRAANIVDFSDLEHLAVSLLYREENGAMVPSETADLLAHGLREIIIDEYQDSNAVQEAILTALSAERFGRPDIFMVGDVKQSIYRFRRADPRLFTEKYDTWTGTGSHIRIELNRNFRSRREVIDTVNAVFERIMRRELGGVEYDGASRLYPGAVYAENSEMSGDGTERPACRTEILIADSTPEEDGVTVSGLQEEAAAGGAAEEDPEELREEELEYTMIARRILELAGPVRRDGSLKVQDRDSGKLRPAAFGDIAVIMRAAKGHAEKLADILSKHGIPSRFQNGQGYFAAVEVGTVLSLLNVLDNPHQDIELAAVMRSPMFGFTDDDLALIAAGYRNSLLPARQDGADAGAAEHEPDLWDAVRACAKDSPELKRFTDTLHFYRELSGVLPVHILLGRIYAETGYYNYVSALPEGGVRRKNLDLLLEKAENYGNTGLRGLFSFTRYIEALRKNEFDYGEAGPAGDNENCVSIMTIHGSKGLEYPVVFLARTAAGVRKGGGDEILTDSVLGVGSDFPDPETGIRYPGMKKLIISRRDAKESAGEDLRLLYVAMTRAREKLIITGAKKASKERSVSEKISDIRTAGELLAGAAQNGEKYPVRSIMKYGVFLDRILLALGEDDSHADIRIYKRTELMDDAPVPETAENTVISVPAEESRDGEPEDGGADSRYLRELDRLFRASYPYASETVTRPKISVSEIKHRYMDAAAGPEESQPVEEFALFGDGPESGAWEEAFGRIRGAFSAQASPGALRGTAFHRAMELLTFRDSFEENMRALEESGLMNAGELELLDRRALERFTGSELYGRMAVACRDGRLKREQRFMAGIPANELDPGQKTDELQILQGIIDAYIEEADGSITLIDYKTDRVPSAEVLADRYRIQLELYGRSLEQLTGKKVGQRLIYSTFLGRQLMV